MTALAQATRKPAADEASGTGNERAHPAHPTQAREARRLPAKRRTYSPGDPSGAIGTVAEWAVDDGVA